MPKHKKKDPKSGKGRVESSDDEGSFNDAASMVSDVSEVSTVRGDEGGEEGVEENGQEQWEGKVKEAIDLAGQKSAAGRVKAVEALCTGLLRRYSPDFLENQQMTLCDVVQRAVKKGRGGEVTAGARLAVLLALQLPDCEEVYRELKPLLVQLTTDKTVAAATRAAAATSLAGLCFLGGGEMAEVVSTMQILEGVFSGSYSKKDGTIPAPSADLQALHCAALSSWSLLLTLLTSGDVFRLATTQVSLLRGLLHSTDVDLRITAGESLALILEFAYDYDSQYEPNDLNGLIVAVRQLATDSNKSRSKKDRKEQRSSFRDVLRGVEEGEPPSQKVKFGREVLRLDTWFAVLQYQWFCKILGPGINLHLASNHMLREIFELGDPLPVFDGSSNDKPSKEERHAANQLARKIRTGIRGKNRDKRSAVV